MSCVSVLILVDLSVLILISINKTVQLLMNINSNNNSSQPVYAEEHLEMYNMSSIEADGLTAAEEHTARSDHIWIRRWRAKLSVNVSNLG